MTITKKELEFLQDLVEHELYIVKDHIKDWTSQTVSEILNMDSDQRDYYGDKGVLVRLIQQKAECETLLEKLK